MPIKDPAKRKEYMREYHRTVWYPANRERRKELVMANKHRLSALITAYKLEKGCTDCGYNKHPQVLDFDHLDDKKFNIASAAQKGYSWENILKEINKCEVVCANCHRIRTATRRDSSEVRAAVL